MKINKEDSLEALCQVLKVETPREVASKLGENENTVAKWKQRGVPARIWKDLRQNAQNIVKVTKLSPKVGAGGGVNVESIDSVEKIGELILDLAIFKTTPPKSLFAMQVDGYSMIPLLFSDSWVVFDSTIKDYAGEGLYVLNFRNTLMVKLLQINEEGHLRIISTNKDYESYTTSLDDQSTFRIFGKVLRSIV
ncbi:MAG: S24 family peptidase [Epsilonproteobacteria bacterium]|nr:S24 family peptidase [Campylobacterota bacterium]